MSSCSSRRSSQSSSSTACGIPIPIYPTAVLDEGGTVFATSADEVTIKNSSNNSSDDDDFLLSIATAATSSMDDANNNNMKTPPMMWKSQQNKATVVSLGGHPVPTPVPPPPTSASVVTCSAAGLTTSAATSTLNGSTLKNSRLHERLAASLAGIEELGVLRDKHRRMIEEVKAHLCSPLHVSTGNSSALDGCKPALAVPQGQLHGSSGSARKFSISGLITDVYPRTPSPTQSLSSVGTLTELGSNLSHRSSLSMDSGIISVSSYASNDPLILHRPSHSTDSTLTANSGGARSSAGRGLGVRPLRSSCSASSFTVVNTAASRDVSEDEGCYDVDSSPPPLPKESPPTFSDAGCCQMDSNRLPAIVVRMRNKMTGRFAHCQPSGHLHTNGGRPKSMYSTSASATDLLYGFAEQPRVPVDDVAAMAIDRRPRVLLGHANVAQGGYAALPTGGAPAARSSSSRTQPANGVAPTAAVNCTSRYSTYAGDRESTFCDGSSAAGPVYRASRVFVQPLSPVVDRKEPSSSAHDDNDSGVPPSSTPSTMLRRSLLVQPRSANRRPQSVAFPNSHHYAVPEVSPRREYTWDDVKRILDPKFTPSVPSPNCASGTYGYGPQRRLPVYYPVGFRRSNNVYNSVESVKALSCYGVAAGTSPSASPPQRNRSSNGAPVSAASNAASSACTPPNKDPLQQLAYVAGPASCCSDSSEKSRAASQMSPCESTTTTLSAKSSSPKSLKQHHHQHQHVAVSRSVSSQSSDSQKSSRRREKTWHESEGL